MTTTPQQEYWNRYGDWHHPCFTFTDTVLLTIPLLLTTFAILNNIGEHLNSTIITVLLNVGLVLVIGYFAGAFK